MAPLPTAAFSRISWGFSGTALPYGAVCSLGITTPEDPQDFVIDLEDLTDDTIRTMLTTTVSITSLDVKVGPEDTGATYSAIINQAGSQSAEAAPPNVCTLVKFGVSGVSSKFSGRMFLPGVNEGQVNAQGAYSNPQLDGLQGAVNDLISGLGGLGVQPHVISSKFSDPTPITSWIVDARVATQRRRLRR